MLRGVRVEPGLGQATPAGENCGVVDCVLGHENTDHFPYKGHGLADTTGPMVGTGHGHPLCAQGLNLYAAVPCQPEVASLTQPTWRHKHGQSSACPTQTASVIPHPCRGPRGHTPPSGSSWGPGYSVQACAQCTWVGPDLAGEVGEGMVVVHPALALWKF